MQLEKRDASAERRVLIGMITDPTVLGRIAPKWSREMFRNKYANLIGSWCIKYFEKYEKAPKRRIELEFERWAENNKDEATKDLVERFLGTLSEEYAREDPNPSEYLIDLAAQHFSRNKKLKLAQALIADVEDGDDAKSDERLAEYSKLELGIGAGVDVLHDKAAIQAAFQEEGKPLVEYPRALYNFFASALERESLLTFIAPPGRGKSWWLIDLAWRAMLQGKRVAFFGIGDMTQNKMMRRFMCRSAKHPWKAGELRYPTGLDCPPGNRRATPTFKIKKFPNPLDWKTAWQACQSITGEQKAPDSKLKLSTHANYTISIAGVTSILDGWERSGWVPDVIVIDYADLLMPVSTRGDIWNQIDETWRIMRGMSQSRHCLLATASQANTEGIKSDTIKLHHFGGSRWILAHASSIVGLSQSDAEKRNQVMRLNMLKNREEDFDTTMPCHVASCLGLANPAVRSMFS